MRSKLIAAVVAVAVLLVPGVAAADHRYDDDYYDDCYYEDCYYDGYDDGCSGFVAFCHNEFPTPAGRASLVPPDPGKMFEAMQTIFEQSVEFAQAISVQSMEFMFTIFRIAIEQEAMT